MYKLHLGKFGSLLDPQYSAESSCDGESCWSPATRTSELKVFEGLKRAQRFYSQCSWRHGKPTSQEISYSMPKEKQQNLSKIVHVAVEICNDFESNRGTAHASRQGATGAAAYENTTQKWWNQLVSLRRGAACTTAPSKVINGEREWFKQTSSSRCYDNYGVTLSGVVRRN